MAIRTNLAPLLALIASTALAAASTPQGTPGSSPPGTVQPTSPPAGPARDVVQQTRTSGRPPLAPLFREEPRIFELTFQTTMLTEIPPTDASLRAVFRVEDSPIVLPFIVRNTWSSVDLHSFASRLWLDAHEDRGASQRSRIERDQAFGMGFAIVPIERFVGQTIRWEIRYMIQSWSSRIDDLAAGEIAWPERWPEECDDALNPQAWIDSGDPIFTEFVERVSEGRLRDVPPYFAAKDLIRHAIASLRVDASADIRREGSAYVGMQLSNASDAARRGTGTPHDLVAVTIAVLRAAGIPSRPVIGVDRNPESDSRSALISWGEFFLPGSGWVPFDPNRMRTANLARRNVRDAWPGLGTMRELNRRIPLSFTFHPPASVISHGWPAVYGWDPRPSVAPNTARQLITISTLNRGRGEPDPR